MILEKKVIYQNGAIREFEKPEVCEAIKVANANRWTVCLSPIEWDEREARLKKEYEKNTKAPGPGEEQSNEGNPALAESASQFNDALLDEQAKKIAELTEEKERLEDKITIFNIFKKRNDEAYRRQIRSLDKEISKLNGIIHDKNAVLSDVAEELRLLKIREKNLTDVSQKYMKENEELKKELDEANKHKQQAYRSCADKNKEIRALKLQISALEKRGNGIDWKRNADAIKLYVNRASHERLWSPISQDICNEQELSFIINHGGKRVKYALRFDGTDIVYECSDPDKKPRIPTPEEPKHDNIFEDFINKTIGNYNRRAAELGFAGSKDGNGILTRWLGLILQRKVKTIMEKLFCVTRFVPGKLKKSRLKKPLSLCAKL